MPPSVIPTPTGWKNIRTTYEGQVRTKFMSQPDARKRLVAIDYFMARLQQDRDAIQGGEPLPTYPPE
ncbi:MAG TPA: hypothetical protein VIB49_02490 [Thermoplasmata archaeon]|jgi:hypothetical protein